MFFGLIAFVLAVLALLVSPIFPNLRYYSNQFFIIPFSRFTRFLLGIKLIILNIERADRHRPVVWIGNHQSALDFALISQGCRGRLVILAKREIKKIPIFGWFFAIAGNVLIDRKNPRAAKAHIDEGRERLRKNNLGLAVFPEGTRSRTSEFLPFKKGAFHVAVSMGFPIVPIVCSSLQGKAIWETTSLGGGHVIVSVLEPIDTKDITLDQVDTFCEQVRNLMLVEYNRINELAISYDEKKARS